MTIKVIIPKAGMGTTEGTIVEWHKKEGDPVEKGELLVEVETAKAVQEIESPISGVLKKILMEEGETGDIYTEIAEIEEV